MITLDTAILAVDHVTELYLPGGDVGTADRLTRSRGGRVFMMELTGNTNGLYWGRKVPLSALEPARNTQRLMVDLLDPNGLSRIRSRFTYLDGVKCEHVRHGELMIGDVIREHGMRLRLDQPPKRYRRDGERHDDGPDCSSWSATIIGGQHPLNPAREGWTLQSIDWGLWRIREVRTPG